jgi:hypothetical protein
VAEVIRVLKGDCRDVLPTLPDESVHCVVSYCAGVIDSAPRPAHITEAMQQAYLRAKELNAVGTGERRLPCP